MSVLYPQLPFTTFPNEIQPFIRMLDITASDAVLIQQYQAAVQAGNMEDAQNIFSQIQDGNAKIINAEKLNTLMDTALALENFFKVDIYPYIDVKQNEWENIINLFSYKKTYNPTTTYFKNNFVDYTVNGVKYVYIAIVDPPIGADPTNTNYWRNLSIRGEKGDSGIGMSFLYEWDSSVSYSTQNVVTYMNYVWGATQANQNQAPFEGSPYWTNIGSIRPRVIPISTEYPASQESGDLWFRIVDSGGGI